MASGFKGTGAKVEKRGKKWAVVHGKTGQSLSTHSSRGSAQMAAAETRDRNRTSTMRSEKNRNVHGS